MVAPTVRYIFVVLFTEEDAICNRYDIGPPRTSVPTDEIEILLSATDQTKISMSPFTIKSKEHAVGCPSACFYIAIEFY